jgi:hypothetical protein
MNLARLQMGVCLAALVVGLSFFAAPALAQEPPTPGAPPVEPVPPSPVQADMKGVIGLGMIGAELGFVLPAAFGMKAWWGYLVFPLIGAAGGGVAGYFALEQNGGHPEVAVAMLVTGVALVIPALVFTVARTSYNADEDMPVTSTARAAQVPASVRQAAAAGPGLLRLAGGDVLVRPPSVTVARSLSPQEARRTGAENNREYQIALLSGRF